jgi:hypothetical protein
LRPHGGLVARPGTHGPSRNRRQTLRSGSESVTYQSATRYSAFAAESAGLAAIGVFQSGMAVTRPSATTALPGLKSHGNSRAGGEESDSRSVTSSSDASRTGSNAGGSRSTAVRP